MTTRELIERAREWINSVIGRVRDQDDIDSSHKLLDAIDAHLSEPQPSTLPVEIHGKFYDVPIPVQVHIVSLGMQAKAAQLDDRNALAIKAKRMIVERCDALALNALIAIDRIAATTVVPDDRKALADEARRLANLVGRKIGAFEELHAAIDRLAAQPVQEPAGDAVMILDMFVAAGFIAPEKLKQAQAIAANFRATPTAPVEQPAQAVPSEWSKAVQEAYGWLWHVNNEPMAPVPMWSPEQAAYEARKCLRDLLTHGQRGEAINAVSRSLENRIAAAPSAQPTSAQAQKEGE